MLATVAAQQPAGPLSPPVQPALAPVLALADLRGWRLLPCWPGTKKACIKDWPTLATTNQEQLRAWAHEFPAVSW